MQKNNKHIVPLLLLAFTLSAINLANADANSDVLAAASKLDKAMLSRDSANLRLLTADSLTYGHTSGKIQTKSEFIGELEAGKTVFKTLSSSNQKVFLDGTTAIVRSHFSAEVAKGTETMPMEIENFQVWQSSHGKWLLIGRQAFKS
ncbi:nuclear transport factor 2 family protein [Pseudomonas sp. MWU16-30317]|uniref:nuclear transport factor 2 family protein n=1 Tax=Pseudomonas sp. MWU16-30317 TaxID=2878095 RepID=UPI001CFBA24B|nr:nuclear transport factor 2 family protein [Pseudomonas sp. MWU16-30317]